MPAGTEAVAVAWNWAMSAQVDEPASAPAPADLERAHELGAPAHGFASQSDAESWLGQVWRELADAGVAAVSLYEEQRLVYGPMSLSPA